MNYKIEISVTTNDQRDSFLVECTYDDYSSVEYISVGSLDDLKLLAQAIQKFIDEHNS